MNKYTLLVDGNYFLFKTLFISGKIKSKGELNFIDEPEKDSDILLSKLSTDFSYEIRRFSPILENVVYCIDSSSWRKDFYPNSNESENASSSTYKGNRKKDKSIDWKKLYEIHDKFANSLKDLGITISRVDGSEADDLIFAWSSYLNMINRNAIIFSGDNDLLQLVCKNDSNESNTLYYNKFAKKLYTFENFEHWLNNSSEEMDIFNMSINSTDIGFKKVLKGIKIQEIDVQEFIFKKILMGDSGDNVSPLYHHTKKSKDGKIRTYSITNNKADKILKKYENEYGSISESTFFNSESISNICQIAKEILKIHDKTLDELIERYETNRSLMMLHSRALPPSIMDAMLESIENVKFEIISNLRNINKDNILKNIIYDERNINPTKSSSFFDNLNL